jgi:hypothetical protein
MLVRLMNAQTYAKNNVTAVQSVSNTVYGPKRAAADTVKTNATQRAAGLSSKANIPTV